MERPTPDAYLTFLNSLRSTSDAGEWLDLTKASLRTLLPEIDHAAWLINILNYEHMSSALNEANILVDIDTNRQSGDLFRPVPESLADRVEVFIDMELEKIGRHRDDIHPPTTVSLKDESWLGTLTLFRNRTSSPFTDTTLDTLEELRPFLTFVLKEFSLKYHAAHPGDAVFYDVIRSSTEELGLTPQEMRVLMFRLFGRSYKEIAEFLSISEATVRNHLTAIHRKAGVHNQNELFARFFAPRFGLFSAMGMTGNDAAEEISPI